MSGVRLVRCAGAATATSSGRASSARQSSPSLGREAVTFFYDTRYFTRADASPPNLARDPAPRRRAVPRRLRTPSPAACAHDAGVHAGGTGGLRPAVRANRPPAPGYLAREAGAAVDPRARPSRLVPTTFFARVKQDCELGGYRLPRARRRSPRCVRPCTTTRSTRGRRRSTPTGSQPSAASTRGSRALSCRMEAGLSMATVARARRWPR